MITERVQNLFDFIDFLHSQVGYLLSKQPLIDKVSELEKKRYSLSAKKHYKDSIEYDKIKSDIDKRFVTIQKEVIMPIKDKITELDIADISTINININGHSDLLELEKNFDKNDLKVISIAKNKYLEFKTKIRFIHFLQLFFGNLDRDLIKFFDFFEDSSKNEFEAFEPAQINDLPEAIEQFKQGNLNFYLPYDFLNPSKVTQDNLEVLPPQQPKTKSGKETRFKLTSIVEGQAQTTQEYQGLKKQIDDNGCFNIHLGNHKVKVYTPELALIFVSKELPARNIDTGIATTINGWDYLKTYIEAYKEGEQYFENEFKVSPNTLYGANAGQYVSDIHSNFFHVKHTGVIEGWSYVKRNYLITITHQAVKEYGYYSGIVSKVEELIEKYHQLFVTFDKCEYGLCKHNTPPQQTETKSDNDLPKQLIIFKDPETVNEFFGILKGYFNDRETDLLKALQGEQLETALLFPHNQNKFVEVFRRAKYNGLLVSSPTEIKNWLCQNFEFRYKRGTVKQIKKINASTAWDILTKGKNEPPKKERICFEGVEWLLPYKSKKQLDNEAQKEQL